MIAKIIAALSMGAVTAFMFQNAVPGTVSFLFWRFNASLAIVVLLSALAGAIVLHHWMEHNRELTFRFGRGNSLGGNHPFRKDKKIHEETGLVPRCGIED